MGKIRSLKETINYEKSHYNHWKKELDPVCAFSRELAENLAYKGTV